MTQQFRLHVIAWGILLLQSRPVCVVPVTGINLVSCSLQQLVNPYSCIMAFQYVNPGNPIPTVMPLSSLQRARGQTNLPPPVKVTDEHEEVVCRSVSLVSTISKQQFNNL